MSQRGNERAGRIVREQIVDLLEKAEDGGAGVGRSSHCSSYDSCHSCWLLPGLSSSLLPAQQLGHSALRGLFLIQGKTCCHEYTVVYRGNNLLNPVSSNWLNLYLSNFASLSDLFSCMAPLTVFLILVEARKACVHCTIRFLG